jgi:hypothetical protein
MGSTPIFSTRVTARLMSLDMGLFYGRILQRKKEIKNATK